MARRRLLRRSATGARRPHRRDRSLRDRVPGRMFLLHQGSPMILKRMPGPIRAAFHTELHWP